MPSSTGKALKRSPERRRRLYPRYRCEFPVTLTLFHGAGHQKIEAHAKDLSEGGMGVLIAAELTPGEVASLVFTLPSNSEPWTVRAVLRHRRGYHYGFEFISLSDQQSKVLETYLPQLPRSDV
jgi:c-di-GMP-binding flagellar brake protein YcgR